MTKHTDTSRSGEGMDWGKPDEITAEVNLSHPVYIQRPQEADNRIEALEAENMMLREERDRLINFVNIMCEEYGLEYDGVVKQ